MIANKHFSLWFILMLLSACDHLVEEQITVGISAAPVTFDPRYATDATSYRIARLLYSSLVDFDEQFNVISDVATWEMLSPVHYRFYLHDAVFHDGTKLDSYDVKATYEYVLDIKHASPHQGSLNMIQSIEVIDKNSFDIYLSKPDPLFLGRLIIGILPAHLIATQHEFNKKPIGSGLFKLLSATESEFTLLRLRDQQQIRFIALADPTVRVLKLLRGEVQLLQGDLSPQIVAWLSQQDNIVVDKKHGNTFSYIGFNMEDDSTSQLAVRQAIAYAIDRESIIQYVMKNTVRIAGAMFPAEHWVGNAELLGSDYDPDKSRMLLSALGYSEKKPLVLSYKTSNNPFRLKLATIIQEQLKQVDIHLKIQSYDWGTFYGDIKAGRFQMYSLSWVGLKMPDIFRYVFHSDAIPPNGANRGRYKSDLIDSLIEQAEQAQSLVDQAVYYRQIQSYLAEDMPYIPLWYEDNVLVMTSNISGYHLRADGHYDALNNIEIK